MSMQVAFPFLLREQVIYWDPTTGLDGGWFQQTMSNKSEHVANPTPILCQCIWQMYSYLLEQVSMRKIISLVGGWSRQSA